MKKLNIMKAISYVGCLLLLLCIGCNETPVFPDPGLDSTSNVVDTVRRDTIDVYLVKMNVKSPNGVKFIQVLDGHNYSMIEQIDKYNGQTNFEFQYAIDLTDIVDNDSTLNRIIKVVDNDLRSYNKAFSLTVKPFSKPTIVIDGGDEVLGLENSSFELKMMFDTGLNTIKSYKVEFDDVVIDEGILEDDISVYHYSKVLDLEMQPDQDHQLKVYLTDNKGEVGMKKMEVRLIELKRPLKVFINLFSSGSPRLNQEWEFYYNPTNNDRLDSISTLFYNTVLVGGVSTLRIRPITYHFGYNSNGDVELVDRLELINNEWVQDSRWTYGYNAQNQLTDVTSVDNSKYNLRFSEWHTDGRPKQFANITDWPITDELPWFMHSSGYYMNAEVRLISARRSIAPKLSNVLIPSHLPSLPQFTPFNGTTMENFQVLLMWKYGFEQVYDYDEDNGYDFPKYLDKHPRIEYSYSTTATGRLSKIVKRTVNIITGVRTNSKEFIFVYE